MNGKAVKGDMQQGNTVNFGTVMDSTVTPLNKIEFDEQTKGDAHQENLYAEDFQNLIEVFKMLREQKNKLDLERE